ncbi:MAG: hypothetical protein M3025_03065, partial [Actinomycetota bacterium]|nr:hypothetical protein [Actinomycetota bacterium]
MAELENSCCTPAAQASCCDPADKASCCGDHHAAGCGCAAGHAAPADIDAVREAVRSRYAVAAVAVDQGTIGCCSPADQSGVFGAALYAQEESRVALSGSLGCGVPTAVADLGEGDVVLDLGSGAGADVLISARRVGVTGKAIG